MTILKGLAFGGLKRRKNFHLADLQTDTPFALCQERVKNRNVIRHFYLWRKDGGETRAYNRLKIVTSKACVQRINPNSQGRSATLELF
jgi:hypothetical protein